VNTAEVMGSAMTVADTPTRSVNSYADLTSEDYFKLLLAQLTNQDPLEPTSNEELLGQIASIRDIEASTSLSDALKSLTGGQQFGSASAMIGRFVTGPMTESGSAVSGVVVGVRFEADGRAILLMEGGMELALDSVISIESAEMIGEELVGKMIFGTDRRDPTDPKTIEGLVTSASADGQGGLLLELDTGEDIRFSDVQRIEEMTTKANPIGKVIDGSAEVLKGLFGI